MPKSIFDIIDEHYGIHNERIVEPKHKSWRHGIQPVFCKERLKKDLTISQKMIVFRFFYNLRNPIDIHEESAEPLIF